VNSGAAGDSLTAGIDLGTQSVKAVLADSAGRVVGSGSSPLTSVRRGPAHEQDPEEWWQAVGVASRQATAGLGGKKVAGVAVCSTSGTVLLGDRRGRPRTPALMYDDGRAREEARMAQEAGAETWASLGYEMQSSFGLPKLLWLLRSGGRPAHRDCIRVLHQADVISSRLAGEPVNTDWSHALKTGYDLLRERWPSSVLESLGIPEEILPRVVRPGTHLGQVHETAAKHCGIPAGTPILAGMTDGCAAQISAGALEEGRWNSVLGTTLVLKGVTHEILHDPAGAVYSHRHPDRGWLPGGASNVGAGAIARYFTGRDLENLSQRAEEQGPATTVAYPLMAEGERFPFVRPEARWLELKEPQNPLDRYLMILEGVAFAERLCFAYLQMLGARVSGPVALTGGGSRSRFWSQLRADVLGRPVYIPRSAEPAVGMAILARAATGSVAKAAARMTHAAEWFEPVPSRTARLAENFDRLVRELVERDYISSELARQAKLV
jgi:sugar (pentulose or hexulose) kinase